MPFFMQHFSVAEIAVDQLLSSLSCLLVFADNPPSVKSQATPGFYAFMSTSLRAVPTASDTAEFQKGAKLDTPKSF